MAVPACFYGASLKGERHEFARIQRIATSQSSSLAAATPFNVTLADDYNSINADCVGDFSAGDWIRIPSGQKSGALCEGVEIRLMVTA